MSTQYLADRILNLEESATIRMATLARELKAQGHNIIDLSLGEPDFDTPEHIKDAAKKAMDEGWTKYTPVPGLPDLRQAIADKFKRDNGLDFSPEQIVVSNGAKQSVANVALCLVNPGEEVILPAPYWVSYSAIAQLAEAKQVFIPTTIKDDFKLSPQQLEAHLTDNTKLIIFSSPCNPTGSVYNKEELAALAEVIERHPKLHVVFDEIYEYINFTGDHQSLAQFDSIKERVITVNGVSKGFAMTGWRIGYMAAALPIAKACAKMQGQFTSGASSISQKATVAALNESMAPTKKMREAFKRRRDMVIAGLEKIEGMKVNRPKGAFYIFPDVSSFYGKSYNGRTISDNEDLAMYILKEAKVSLVSGQAFGDDNCIRFSYATSEANLEEALSRLGEALAKLS